MRGFALSGSDAPPALLDDLPAPAPADDEVLVRVHASSVNPVDNAIAAGMLRGMGSSTSSPSSSGATTPASSSRSAPRHRATRPATRSSASSRTPTRPCTTAPGPS